MDCLEDLCVCSCPDLADEFVGICDWLTANLDHVGEIECGVLDKVVFDWFDGLDSHVIIYGSIWHA